MYKAVRERKIELFTIMILLLRRMLWMADNQLLFLIDPFLLACSSPESLFSRGLRLEKVHHDSTS
jgi:hypothetical protein